MFQYFFCHSSDKPNNKDLIRLESGLGQVYNDGYGYNILNQVKYQHFPHQQCYKLFSFVWVERDYLKYTALEAGSELIFITLI